VSGEVFLASFDVEDWFHAANVVPYLGGAGWETLEGRVERNTHRLLDILAESRARSTFFVLGWVARRYPGLIRRIADEGHEIASHTDRHKLLSSLSRDELKRDLARARATLEDLTGKRVLGIRAPSFSISEAVLDCMAEAGYWYDSSFFSLRGHSRYGRLASAIDPDLPVVEARAGLLELPMSRLRLGRAALPWAGGAYFRLTPYAVYRAGVARRLRAQSWFMFYLHPWELDPAEVPPARLPAHTRVRAYAGRGRMARDLRRLLAEFGSCRIDDALRSLGFTPPAP
jgi:polysaccharide deacetylase family protein (PEP-CTERM system associated)